MNAFEWEYIGEGGKHAVFAFTAANTRQRQKEQEPQEQYVTATTRTATLSSMIQTTTNFDDDNHDVFEKKRNKFHGRVLRINKKYLAYSSNWNLDTKVCNGSDGDDVGIVDDVEVVATRTTPNVGGTNTKEDNINVNVNNLFSNNELQSSIKYIQQIIAPSLSPYVDIPELIILDWSFLRHLKTRTISNDCIPITRRPDWDDMTINDSSGEKITDRQKRSFFTNQLPLATATLWYDYRQLHLPTSYDTSPLFVSQKSSIHFPTTLCVEIKPKGGYLSFSPLVDKEHRIKYEKSRFVLLQDLYQKGYVDKGWTRKSSEKVHRSDYDPIDLFSNDTIRMKKAIMNLFASPQNNLRIWNTDGLLWSHNNISESLVKQYMRTTVQQPEDQQRNHHHLSSSSSSLLCEFQSYVTDILVEVLKHETILSKLLQLQKLDILDADGAITIYNILVKHHCNGNKDRADELLDTWTGGGTIVSELEKDDDEKSKNNDGNLLQYSPYYQFFHETPALKSLINDIFTFQQHFNNDDDNNNDTKVQGSSISPELMNQTQNLVIEKVNRLSMDECLYLLSNWLLSLLACDVSIFFTLKQIDSKTLPLAATTMTMIRTPTTSTTEKQATIIKEADTCYSTDTTTSSQENCNTPRIYDVDIIQTIDETTPGILTVATTKMTTDRRKEATKEQSSVVLKFAYNVRIVDCDKKAASKLRKRQKVESVFRHL